MIDSNSFVIIQGLKWNILNSDRLIWKRGDKNRILHPLIETHCGTPAVILSIRFQSKCWYSKSINVQYEIKSYRREKYQKLINVYVLLFFTLDYAENGFVDLLIQQGKFANLRLLNNLQNWVTLRQQNLSLKCCWPFELFSYHEKGFKSFHTFDMRSVGQRLQSCCL